MGNCFKSIRVTAQSDERLGEIKANQSAGRLAPRPVKAEETRRVAKGKKTVRFKLVEDNSGGGREIRRSSDDNSGGVLRIKVVVSQKELKQMLNGEDDFCTLEEMIAELRMRGRAVSEAIGGDDGDRIGGWRPALESIPEEIQ